MNENHIIGRAGQKGSAINKETAKRLLEDYLINSKFDNIPFFENQDAAGHLVDFVSYDYWLVIEIVEKNDKLASSSLDRYGYLVLSFTEDEVKSELDSVLLIIKEAVESLFETY